MKKLTLLLTILLFSSLAFSQQTTDKKEINKILATFTDCLVKKDSLTFYSLFHNDPVVWIGVFKEKTHQDIMKKSTHKENYFSSNYKGFFRSIIGMESVEEKYKNVEIIADESISSITFDYSFWGNNKKINWGKESWGLVKANGQWKITSIIFSIELEDIVPEPG
jgi:hypothetical protein